MLQGGFLELQNLSDLTVDIDEFKVNGNSEPEICYHLAPTVMVCFVILFKIKSD